MEYYSVKKKDLINDTCNHLDKSPRNYVEKNPLIPKGYILYDFINITFVK